MKSLILLGCTLLSGAVAPSLAQPRADLSAEWVRVRADLDQDRPRAAIDRLKALQARTDLPADATSTVAMLLGAAYVADSNPAWALNILSSYLAERPDDCEARTWAARAWLEQANPDEADALLDDPACGGRGPVQARAALLRALAAAGSGRGEAAAQQWRVARLQPAAWPGERNALHDMGIRLDPDHVPDLTWRIDAGGGVATNALMGAPTDPALAGREPLSPFFALDLHLRGGWAWGAQTTGEVEGTVRGLQYSAADASGLSYVDLSARPGVRLGQRTGGWLLGWRPSAVLVAQGDRYDAGPLWLYVGHRGEIEGDLGHGLLLFAGAGYRGFREAVRTRVEADGGLGWSRSLGHGATVAAAASARGHAADGDGWDLWGVGALATWHQAWGRFHTRLSASGAFDDFPRSSGWFDADARRDRLGRLVATGWAPAWRGVKAGLQVEATVRDSTADRYAFQDVRASVRLQWSGSADVTGPALAAVGPVAEMRYVAGEGQGGLVERVQDLLRQDEQVQRSSSCLR